MTKYVLINLFACALLLESCQPLTNEQGTASNLRFNETGEFKIVQFTDLHWADTSPNVKQTEAVIKFVLETERPDVAIMTGDLVTSPPAEDVLIANE